MDKDISLDLYRIFCTVVKTGNMSLAAKELFISQPAVSMSIKQLEDKAGSPLLIRTSKGVRTTPEGSVLYEYLEQALNLIKTAENKYMEMVNLKAGEIKIGASDTVIANLLMPYLEQYAAIYPTINIHVTNQTTYESLRLLKKGIVDICFVNLPIEEDCDLEITPVKIIHDCLVGGKKYEHLKQDGITLQNLVEYPLLMLENSSNSRRFLDEFAKTKGVVFTPNIELGSTDLLLSFAKINLGLTFATREFCQKELEEESLFEISVIPPIPEREIGLVKLKTVAMSHAAKSFTELIK